MAEGVAAGNDAHQARILEAGEIVPAPQRAQHVAHPLRLPARVVEIEIDAKALGRGARHSHSPGKRDKLRLISVRVARTMWQTLSKFLQVSQFCCGKNQLSRTSL